MAKLSLKECLSFGWNAFKKRPLVYILTVVIINALWYLAEYVSSESVAAALPGTWLVLSILLTAALMILAGAVHVVITTNFFLKAHDAPEAVKYSDIFRSNHFWKLVGVFIISGVLIFIGTILLIIPGLILGAMFAFAGYLAVEKGLGPIAAMKRSAALTKGNRFILILLLLCSLISIIASGIVGWGGDTLMSRIVEFVLDLVVLPVTMLAFAHAYRVLEAGYAAQPEARAIT